MTPAARSRVQVAQTPHAPMEPITIEIVSPRDWPGKAGDDVARKEPEL